MIAKKIVLRKVGLKNIEDGDFGKDSERLPKPLVAIDEALESQLIFFSCRYKDRRKANKKNE